MERSSFLKSPSLSYNLAQNIELKFAWLIAFSPYSALTNEEIFKTNRLFNKLNHILKNSASMQKFSVKHLFTFSLHTVTTWIELQCCEQSVYGC